MGNAMEPEDRELIQQIMNHYKWPGSYDYDVDEYMIKTPSRKSNGEIDLSAVSTRELLNECYRRRAIECFKYTTSVDKTVYEQDAQVKPYIENDILKGLTYALGDNHKFKGDAIVVKESRDASMWRYEFAAELYICKHPTKVKGSR
jgi:hypothetical protein